MMNMMNGGMSQFRNRFSPQAMGQGIQSPMGQSGMQPPMQAGGGMSGGGTPLGPMPNYEQVFGNGPMMGQTGGFNAGQGNPGQNVMQALQNPMVKNLLGGIFGGRK